MSFRSSFHRFHQRAFTLIEMLVVLIIVAMVVTLIVQGFGYTLGLYQRVVRSQNNAYQQVFTYHWLTSSLQVQVAMRPKDRGLEGDSSHLSTYSFRPLLAPQGLKTLIRWELKSNTNELVLSYVEGQIQFPVYRWPYASGQFEYLTETGQWVGRWPLEKTDSLPLPKAVRVVVNSSGESLNYVVNIETRKRAEVGMDELLYGRE